MPYEIQFLPSVLKSLNKLDLPTREKVFSQIALLAEDPRPDGCKKLAGQDSLYRIRIGQYRVIYKIDDGALVVLAAVAGRRKDIYQRLRRR